MRNSRISTLFLLLTLTLSSGMLAKEQQANESRLKQFYLTVITKGPKWTSDQSKETTDIRQQHMHYVASLVGDGRMVIGGPFSDGTDTLGVSVYRAKSMDEAKSIADADPASKAGFFNVEIHPWWSEDIFQRASSPLKFTPVYFAFLKKGPNRKDGDDDTPAVKELQKAHLANINRLAGLKKLVVAGPFGDNGDLRGIFVFRVGTIEEARELYATDPMVKSGRLVVELHPWQIPDGIIP